MIMRATCVQRHCMNTAGGDRGNPLNPDSFPYSMGQAFRRIVEKTALNWERWVYAVMLWCMLIFIWKDRKGKFYNEDYIRS